MGRHKNSRQEDALIDFMQNHVDVARGFTRGDKVDTENVWKDLVAELNSLGPPMHDVNGWKKIWTCWKAAIKKKISTNKKEVMATGGGPYNQMYISKKEEVLGQICGLYAFVEGIGNAKSAGDESGKSSSEDDLIEESNSNNVDPSRKRKYEEFIDSIPSTSKRFSRNIRKTPTDNIKENLKTYVENDLKNGKELCEAIKEISETAKKTNETLNTMCSNIRRIYKSIENLTTNISTELKRHHKEMEKTAITKNELKKLDLEIKQKQLELEELRKM